MAEFRNKVVQVGAADPSLEEVMALWRTDSATLGFMPSGAFVEHALKGWILGAVDQSGRIVGYLLFRIGKGRATIAHLCVKGEFRGQGVAKALVDHLVARCLELALSGITLSCRRDYAIAKMWPKLGFAAVAERLGRGDDGGVLTVWWRDNHLPSLFSLIEERDTRTKVVIDANVFYDCHVSPDADSEESRSLLAPWLTEEIELLITEELFNEIARQEDKVLRDRARNEAHKYPRAKSLAMERDKCLLQLRSLLPAPCNESDESDARQLACTIVAGVSIFVTRDRILLLRKEKIFEATGLRIASPAELVTDIDQLLRDQEYGPERLAGSSLRYRRAVAADEAAIVSTFQGILEGEAATDIRRKVNTALSQPKSYEVKIVETDDVSPMAVCITTTAQDRLEFTFLRASKSGLRATLIRHLLQRGVYLAASHGAKEIVFSDHCSDEETEKALLELGFRQIESVWRRFALKHIGTFETCLATLKKLPVLDCLKGVPEAGGEIDGKLAFELEKQFWPLKIQDADVPTFIVPIRPVWAEKLFDSALAARLLWGTDPLLMLNIENVYYRSASMSGLKAPGRILWYVSKEQGDCGLTMQIRACSLLDEIVCGPAKALFRKYKRLGAYTWNQVVETADGNAEGQIMAIRFTGTELFKKSIPLERLQRLGIKTPIQSPRAVSRQQFEIIYREGMEE